MSDSARGASGGLWWSLAGRVWLTNLILVLLMAALGVLAISRLALLESSVNRALSRNYQSIQAAQKMSGVIAAFRSGDLSASQARADFRQWLAAEREISPNRARTGWPQKSRRTAYRDRPGASGDARGSGRHARHQRRDAVAQTPQVRAGIGQSVAALGALQNLEGTSAAPAAQQHIGCARAAIGRPCGREGQYISR